MKNIFLSLVMISTISNTSLAASHTLEIPSDVYDAKIRIASVSNGYTKRIISPSCKNQYPYHEGQSDCTELLTIMEPILTLTIELQSDYSYSHIDPMEGDNIVQVKFLLKDLDEKTKENILNSSDQLSLVKQLILTRIFNDIKKQRISITTADCQYPRWEGQSDCSELGTEVHSVTKKFLTIILPSAR